MKNNNKTKAIILRKKAESVLKKKPKTSSTHSEAETLKLIHELEVHQIELEMMNEELVLSRAKEHDTAEKYAELYDFAPSGYFVLSKEGKIIDLNLAGSQMVGRERKRVYNSLFGLFISDDTKPIFNLFLGKVFISKDKVTCEVNLSTNENLPMFVHLTGVVTENGERCLINVIDITGRKQAEAEINSKNQELFKLITEKDKFFSIIAHDLRSPFNALLGFTRMMAEDLPSLSQDEIQKIANTMRASASNLHSLLENLLEWSQLQRGLIPYNPVSFLLMPKIKESIPSVFESANKKGIEVSLDITEDLVVFADGNMLGSTIRNIASNAVKFTSKGGKVIISAKTFAGKSVEISIKDTGIGMSKEILDKLFRLDGNTNRKGTDGEPSTGLGLIICKEFVEKNRGEIWVESEEGKGSMFNFTLPNHNQ